MGLLAALRVLAGSDMLVTKLLCVWAGYRCRYRVLLADIDTYRIYL